jgi:hypothetical protein
VFTPIASPALAALRRDLEAHPRQHGYYLLSLLALDVPHPGAHEDSVLDALFEQLDDTSWPPAAVRRAQAETQSWADYLGSAAAARATVVEALIGGAGVGHIHDTIQPAVAEALWARFERLFDKERSYYLGVGLGKREHVFQRGVVIVDGAKAGALFVVEDD